MNFMQSSLPVKMVMVCSCVLFVWSNTAIGQIPTSGLPGRVPTEVEKANERVSKVIAIAEEHFRRGKQNLDDNRRAAARDEFDQAVDTILESGLDIRANQRLQNFYTELVERIYREEVPIGHGHRINQIPKVGFSEQKFAPGPLDELSKLIIEPTTRESFEVRNRNNSGCQKPPSLRSLFLGMTIAQLRSLYPRAQSIVRRNELSELVVSIPAGSDVRLKGIHTLRAFFLDGKLFLLSIKYADQIEWTGVDQFVAQFSGALGMPTRWSNSGAARILACKSFFVHAKMIARSPEVGIVDSAAFAERNAREASLKSPATFRP